MENTFQAEVLRENGWATYWVGKNHNVPVDEFDMGSSKRNWPLARGAETVPFVDVSAARMLGELDRDLRRDGARLLLARDVGQVRDVLRRTGADSSLAHVYPIVAAAVEAARRA